MNINELINSKQLNIKKWLKLFSYIRSGEVSFAELISDDIMRRKIQFFCIYIIFFVISIVMTIMNYYTQWYRLGICTCIFGILNFINGVLCLFNEKTEKISQVLLAIEIEVLFIVFAIFGDPEGFSIIWVALLPTSGLLLYGNKYGTLLSVIQLLCMCVLFWTPIGSEFLQYEYTESFLMRFPVLYIAFYFVGFFFEFVRSSIYSELLRARDDYQYMAIHDTLTDLYNRNGFNNCVAELLENNYSSNYSLAIADIDRFKAINDKYGHTIGDVILKQLSAKIAETVGEYGIVCRWGGEEFAIFFTPNCDSSILCSRLIREVENTLFDIGETELHLTISIGLAIVSDDSKLSANDIIIAADDNLYYAKQHGRNQVHSTILK